MSTPPRHAPKVGNYESSRFNLTVFADCFAVLSDSNTVGQPVKFLELYNVVADGHLQNLEACVAAENVVGGKNILRITAPHAYGHVDIAINATVSDPWLVFTVADTSQWQAANDTGILAFGLGGVPPTWPDLYPPSLNAH